MTTRLAAALWPLRRRKDLEAVLARQAHDIARLRVSEHRLSKDVQWLRGECAALTHRVYTLERETDERTAYQESVCQSRLRLHVEEHHLTPVTAKETA